MFIVIDFITLADLGSAWQLPCKLGCPIFSLVLDKLGKVRFNPLEDAISKLLCKLLLSWFLF